MSLSGIKLLLVFGIARELTKLIILFNCSPTIEQGFVCKANQLSALLDDRLGLLELLLKRQKVSHGHARTD